MVCKITDNNIYNLVNHLDIKKNDILLITSNTVPIIIEYKKKGTVNFNKFIDKFLEKLGKNGTLLFPTFSWNFCKGLGFDYYKTSSETGSLSKIALQRSDFTRTKHPIYSFAVTGKDSKKLFKLDYKSGWGKDSVFDYLYKNNAKNLFIGMDYKDGFTFDHFIEEKNKVDYRFFKTFSGSYTDKNKKTIIKKYKMFVRDLNLNGRTEINPKLDKILIKNNCYKKYKLSNINIGLINLKTAGKIMDEDIKKNGGLIFSRSLK